MTGYPIRAETLVNTECICQRFYIENVKTLLGAADYAASDLHGYERCFTYSS